MGIELLEPLEASFVVSMHYFGQKRLLLFGGRNTEGDRAQIWSYDVT